LPIGVRDNMPNIVRASPRKPRGSDPTFYPVEEKVGEDLLQRWIMELLRPLVERWLASRKVLALVGADQFIYYRQHAPTVRVSPDIYVLPGVRPGTRVPSWKTWETGIVPSFAFEIVSKDWEKDYAESPVRYAELGVSELVIFDPAPERHPDGVVWQVFRRVGDRPLRQIEVSQGDRVRSKVLGCFLRVVGSDDSMRVRLASGPRGDTLFPTAEEAERAAKETERASKETERAEKETERTAKEAALAEKEAALAAADTAVAQRDVALARLARLEAELGSSRRRRKH